MSRPNTVTEAVFGEHVMAFLFDRPGPNGIITAIRCADSRTRVGWVTLIEKPTGSVAVPMRNGQMAQYGRTGWPNELLIDSVTVHLRSPHGGLAVAEGAAAGIDFNERFMLALTPGMAPRTLIDGLCAHADFVVHRPLREDRP